VRLATDFMSKKKKGNTTKEKWWKTEHELRKEASDICASYDIVWRVANGGHRRFFRGHWASSICWTHEALQTSITARQNGGDKRTYEGFAGCIRKHSDSIHGDPGAGGSNLMMLIYWKNPKGGFRTLTQPTCRLSTTLRKRSRAASRFSIISAAISSGGGNRSGSSASSLSQKMSRLTLSRAIRSA
jgi:hypothetical protein